MRSSERFKASTASKGLTLINLSIYLCVFAELTVMTTSGGVAAGDGGRKYGFTLEVI